MEEKRPFILPHTFRIRYDGIDAEHDALVTVINDFAHSLADGQTEDFEGPFHRFLAFMDHHFKNEESQMRALGYRGLAWHHDHHQDCLSRARGLRETCRERGFADMSVIYDCFDDIVNDIARADLKFGEYLDDLGLRERRPADT